MTISELENYILSKPNAQKTVIPELDYVRYTAYSVMFASIGKAGRKIVLTLWGKYPQYESEYPGMVISAADNEPKHFTSAVLSDGHIPSHVLKSMIDYSYRERMRSIIMPKNCSDGDSRKPYDMTSAEIAATAGSDFCTVTTDSTGALSGYAIHNDAGNEHIPYDLPNNKKKMENFIKLSKNK